MSCENLPHLPGPAGPGDAEPAGNRWEPSAAEQYDELNEIRADSVMRRHAQRLAGDLAEDLLQETWYIVARASASRPIDNLSGYFYRVMVNAAKRLRADVAHQGIPSEDPAAAAGPHRARQLAAASAEDAALPEVVNDARRDRLRHDQAGLRPLISACSPDPDRYRDAIFTVAGQLLADGGPANQTEVNDALVAAYPEWFAAPGAATATIDQRRFRGRRDIKRVLAVVIGF
jgi:DNA-directed RNA polymerase specialized sigma24 family protein